ncbi:MAG: molybdenum cofactor biosynthesis protein MoaE [Acidimicrobiales bacterium]
MVCSVVSGEWIELTADTLPVAEVSSWAIRPRCGALDVFVGTVRDHSQDRPGVRRLEYEAYEAGTIARFEEIATQARRRWPEIGRIAILHRTGPLCVGDAAVLIAVSAPHRASAFAATSWCIETLKATAPIWKLETWDGGRAWGSDARQLTEVAELGQVP